MDLDSELDRLYGLPFDEFTSARDELVKRLRADKQRELAAEVRKLRRPSIPAWAVNQLARRHRGDVNALIEASERLRAEQRRALSTGGADALRAAARERKRAVAALVRAAAGILTQAGHAASASHQAKIADTLNAAALDAASADAVRSGRLTHELSGAGFADTGSLRLVPTRRTEGPTDEPSESVEPEPGDAEPEAPALETVPDAPAVTATDVEQAAARIAGRVHRTPVLRCASLDALAGAELYLKAENLQRVGAFKARGAFNALLSMTPAERRGGVLAVSSGNHAQAVAVAARDLGVPAVIVMPADANPVKVRATHGYGAEVVQHGVTEANRESFVAELAAERGLPLVHPFDDPRVIAGQGTCGLELTEQTGPLDAVVVPVGGGGLIAGVAAIVKDRWPQTTVIGVEPEAAADAQASLRAGRIVALDSPPRTIVDGVRSARIGTAPWSVIARLVDDIVTVSDEEALAAMELMWTRAKTVVEPAGALPLAAVLRHGPPGGRVGLIVSGGNVDLDAWAGARRA